MNALRLRWQTFVAQRHPEATAELTLVHKRIYILPSRRGLGLILLLVLSLIGAINYQLSLGFFFVFLLAGIANSALLHTYSALLGLRIRIRPAEPVFAGEAAQFPLEIGERQGRLRSGITLFAPDGSPLHGDLPRHGEYCAQLDVQTAERGQLRFPRSRIECRNPTGWFVAWSYLAFSCDCLVYPRPEPAPPPLPLGQYGKNGGLYARQGDDDFAGLRDYHPGDAPSHIAWRQAARSETLQTKTFQSPQSSDVVLDWGALNGLDTEARLSRLTAWILHAEAQGQRYALRIPGYTRPPGIGAEQRSACLAALALFPHTESKA